jgi:hypothetical protein
MTHATTETGPELLAEALYKIARDKESVARGQFVLKQLIEICADFYLGYDYNKDAIGIAKLVVCDETEDEPTALQILKHMGYLVWLMLDWEGLTPETVAKLKQVRDLVFRDDPLFAETLQSESEQMVCAD